MPTGLFPWPQRTPKVTKFCVFPKNRAGAGKAEGRMIGARSLPRDSLPAGGVGGQAGWAASCRGCAHLLWVGYHKGHEGIHGHHPRRDGGPKTLPEERPKRDVLPLLCVSSYRRKEGLTSADGGLAPTLPGPRPRSTDGALAPTWLPRTKRPQHPTPRTEVPWVTVPGYSREKNNQRAGTRGWTLLRL